MNDEQLQAIKARAEAATPGPWVVEDSYKWTNWPVASWAVGHDPEDDTLKYVTITPAAAYHLSSAGVDAAFIAAARADVPALVAEVERLRAELAAVPVAEIGRWAYDYQTVNDERAIIAWIQARDESAGAK